MRQVCICVRMRVYQWGRQMTSRKAYRSLSSLLQCSWLIPAVPFAWLYAAITFALAKQPGLHPQVVKGRPDERKAPPVHALAAFACPSVCQRKSIQLSRDHAGAAASVSRMCRLLQAPGPPVMAAFVVSCGCKDSCTETLLSLKCYQVCCLLRKSETEAAKCLLAHIWGSESYFLQRRTGRTLAPLSCLTPQKLLLHSSALIMMSTLPVSLPVPLTAVVDRLTSWTLDRVNHGPATNLTVRVVLHMTSVVHSNAPCHTATTNFCPDNE